MDAFRLLGWRRKPSAVLQGSWDPDWKRDIVASLAGVPGLGWVLATRVHGKGYATEAVRGRLHGDANIGTAQPTLGGRFALLILSRSGRFVWRTNADLRRSSRRRTRVANDFLRGRSWVQVGLKSHAYSDPFGATDFKACRRHPCRQAAGRVGTEREKPHVLCRKAAPLEKQIARCGYPQRARLGQKSLRNWSVLTGGDRLA